jgi:hypothetical protein
MKRAILQSSLLGWSVAEMWRPIPLRYDKLLMMLSAPRYVSTHVFDLLLQV